MVAQSSYAAQGYDDIGISNLLLSFCRAMAVGDLPKAMSAWETPAMIIGQQESRALGSRTELSRFFAAAKNHYNAEGASGSRPDIVNIHSATDTLAVVEVRWPHLDEESNELGAEVWTYVLRRDAKKEWKIRVGILHARATNWDSGA